MNIINLENVKKTFGDRVILNSVSLGINEHDKIGIIGVNGTGKTTFLKIIAGIEECDEGEVIKANGITISMLSQVPEFDKDASVIEYVSMGGYVADSWDKEGDAKNILTKLGITDYNQDISTMSGGQKKRVALARTLIHHSDVLIMDEPTNHLDNDMVEWLEEYLKKYRGVLIMVTHDRYFLDSVTNKIVEIDKGGLYTYETNYSGFLKLKSQREEMALATQEKRENILRNELKWVMRGARARSTKQKARLSRYEEMKQIRGIEKDSVVEMKSVSSRLGNKTLEACEVSKRYGEKVIIDKFSYIFTKGINIGIVGNNGSGKTTLLNILTGISEPDDGYVETGETVKIGYFTQEVKNMNPEQRVIDYVRDIAEFLPTSNGAISASKMLERFLFTSDMQYTCIGKLSGGEKRRLYLLSILMQAPNILVLDEPTNDLDISTLTVLEDYIDQFNGIVITVSHDRYFLDRIVDRILAFEGAGVINQYEGGYTDYKNKTKDIMKISENTSEIKEKTKKTGTRKRKMSYNEQREYETIDDEIAVLEEKIVQADEEIAKNSSNYYELNQWMEKKQTFEKELEEKMERWMYLQDLSEQIENER